MSGNLNLANFFLKWLAILRLREERKTLSLSLPFFNMNSCTPSLPDEFWNLLRWQKIIVTLYKKIIFKSSSCSSNLGCVS